MLFWHLAWFRVAHIRFTHKSTNILMGLSCGATLFLLAGIIVQSRNDYTINTPSPKPRIFASCGLCVEKK